MDIIDDIKEFFKVLSTRRSLISLGDACIVRIGYNRLLYLYEYSIFDICENLLGIKLQGITDSKGKYKLHYSVDYFFKCLTNAFTIPQADEIEVDKQIRLYDRIEKNRVNADYHYLDSKFGKQDLSDLMMFYDQLDERIAKFKQILLQNKTMYYQRLISSINVNFASYQYNANDFDNNKRQ